MKSLQAQSETLNTLAVKQISVTAHMCALDNSDPKRARFWHLDAEEWCLIHYKLLNVHWNNSQM